jgi:hypothetical protein
MGIMNSANHTLSPTAASDRRTLHGVEAALAQHDVRQEETR